MDGDAADVVVADQLALAGVHSCAQLEVERAHGLTHRDGAADRAGGTVERCQNAVAGRLDMPPAVSLDLSARRGVVPLEHRPPAPVAERGRFVRRADYV